LEKALAAFALNVDVAPGKIHGVPIFFPLKKQISNLDLKIVLPQDINKARKREVSSAINVPFISYSHSYQSGNGFKMFKGYGYIP
jgi:hypothetical protein